MKARAFSLAVVLMAALAIAVEKTSPAIVELPRPNSGTFSYAQAEARKSEILANAPSGRMEDWKNPYWGFSVHVAKDDSVTVYNHGLKGLAQYEKPRLNQSAAQIDQLLDELPLGGKSAGVLVTSEVPLKDSKAIHDLLKVLFVPSVQIFYLKNADPPGTASPK